METQYCSYHIQKGKGHGAGLGHHIDRTEGMGWAYPNADPDRQHLNLDFTPERYQGKLLSECVRERIAEGYHGKKELRNDAVKYINHMMSGTHERMKEIEKDPQLLQQWISTCRGFMEREFGSENILRFTVHLDEKTPHIHCVTVPLTADGRLSAKERMGNPAELQAKQDRFGDIMKPFGLERGIRNTKVKHQDTKKYYGQIAAAEKDKKQLVDAVQEVMDKHKIHPFNIPSAKEAIRSDLSDLVANAANAIAQDLMKENNALRSKIKAIDSKSRYASVVGAAHALKERLPILSYFSQLVSKGLIRYEGRRGTEHYFANPSQKTGSITVNDAKGVYYDHSSGKGGDLVKAAQQFEKKGWTEAVNYLSEQVSDIEASMASWKQATERAAGKSLQAEGQKAEITNVFDQVQHPALVQYIKSRGIDMEVARSLKEIHWNVGDSRYFGVAMPTAKGGFAVSSPVFKGNLEAGGITTGISVKDQEPTSVRFFEGMFDYLSYRTVYPAEVFLAVVLNSTSNLTNDLMQNISKLYPDLPVHLHLDNDDAGKKATAKALQQLPNATDKSSKYSQYKDLNEAHLAALKLAQEHKKRGPRLG